ncbi:hypothetical protein BpHYR1_024423 [Brachionus plicatilis]|uniref:Uncharacterized protein n=1 Tax=Brachionus plicatilis TaxID=10195 RepID=A0A3M7QGQ7_BRAPC|nr:hypothetical protein BpHYR1_024423 [Brachionus plicatilis]
MSDLGKSHILISISFHSQIKLSISKWNSFTKFDITLDICFFGINMSSRVDWKKIESTRLDLKINRVDTGQNMPNTN